jgi:hypothetical protein
MTARRDGVFGEAISAIKSQVDMWESGVANDDAWILDGKIARQVIREMRQVMAVLRAAEKAKVDPEFYIRGAGFADSESEIAVARAILNARRVHDRGKVRT